MAPSQFTIDTLSERMAELLSQSPNPLREMADVENLLESKGYQISPSRESPARFSWEVFKGAPELVRAAEKQRFNAAHAESAEDLVSRLLPSDGHLE